EMAIDEGAYGPVLDSVDLEKRAPKQIRLRPKGTEAAGIIDIHYTPVSAAITATPAADLHAVNIMVTFSGLGGINVAAKVAPSVHWRRIDEGGKPLSRPLLAGADGVFGTVVPLSGEPGKIRVDVLDSRGSVLGTSVVDLQKPKEAPAPTPKAAPPVP